MASRGKRSKSRRGKRGARKKPTYETSLRMVKFVQGLESRSYGWSLERAAEDLGVSTRTIRRYVEILGEEFTDEAGKPLYRIVKRSDGLRVIKGGPGRDEIPGTIYHLVSAHLALEFFRMLGENVVAFSVEDMLERIREHLTQKQQALLRDLERKFYTAPSPRKDYTRHVEILEDIMTAVVYQNVMEILYRPAGADEAHWLPIKPLTLLFHRGSFYVVALAKNYKNPYYYAVERIEKCRRLRDKKFEYPSNYHPQQMLDGAFGIFKDPRSVKTFKIKFPPEMARYIKSFKIHETQKMKDLKDGSVLLTLRVTDSMEVRSWIASFGPNAELLSPKE